MKILKEGTIPEPQPPWWVGEVIACGNCKAQVDLEIDDEPDAPNSFSYNSITRTSTISGFLKSRCPICDWFLVITFPSNAVWSLAASVDRRVLPQ